MTEDLAAAYRRFAHLEARGVSAVYDDWAVSIADDAVMRGRIAELPGMKRQPNLVFAAARFVGAPVGPYPVFREWLLENWDAVATVVMDRATQTNEAGRCAVLMPVLSRWEGPLALIEAGASAGLVLYPDRYSYRYDLDGETVRLDPPEGRSSVELDCAIDRESLPSRLPEVAWRAGVDLNPLDVGDPAELAWLETLVWPEHDARRARLRAAATLVAADPPRLERGDIVDVIPSLVASAPAGIRVVVFHSSVLVYLTAERRREFVDLMASLDQVTWISNEGPQVLPEITEQVGIDPAGRTILAVDGCPVALGGPHGQSYQAI